MGKRRDGEETARSEVQYLPLSIHRAVEVRRVARVEGHLAQSDGGGCVRGQNNRTMIKLRENNEGVEQTVLIVVYTYLFSLESTHRTKTILLDQN